MSYSMTYGWDHEKELKITQSTRERIYEEIWSEPLYKLAPKYNLTSGPFKKRCKECWDIPVPESGYWARYHAGKKDKRPPLPMPPAKEARFYVSEYAVSYISLEDVPKDELYTTEPLFVFSDRTKQLLTEAEEDLKARTVITNLPRGYANILKSAKIENGTSEYRGLCILYALFAKAEEFEGQSHLGDLNQGGHLFTGYITLCRQDWCYHMNYDTESGKLSLSFFWSRWGFDYNKEAAAYRMIFADKDDLPLEEQIVTVFHTLMVESGKKIQEEELARRAEIIRKADAERARKLKPYIEEENKKVEKALADARAYHDAQIIRTYAEAYYEKNCLLFDSQPRLKEYYDWLQQRADWLDPLIENDYDRFLSPE